MINVGQVVYGTVVEQGSYGIYLRVPKEPLIFVPFGELSWKLISDSNEIASIGDSLAVLIEREPLEGIAHYLGTIKKLSPHENPEFLYQKYQVGTTHTGRVVQISNENFAIVELEKDVFAGIKLEDSESVLVGKSIIVELIEVNSERQVIVAKKTKDL